MAWLTCIALSLVTMGAFFDVAVRDLQMAIAAYTLARLTEARAGMSRGQQPLTARAA
jgi:hypothetical protein